MVGKNGRKNYLFQKGNKEKKKPKSSKGSGDSAGHEGTASGNDDLAAKCNLPAIPEDAMGKYVRIKTGVHAGLLGRVTNCESSFRARIMISREPPLRNVYTTVKAANFILADIETLSDAERDIYEHDMKMRVSADSSSVSRGKKALRRVFEVDLTDKYIRLIGGRYEGKIGIVTSCPVDCKSCNVKVKCSAKRLLHHI